MNKWPTAFGLLFCTAELCACQTQSLPEPSNPPHAACREPETSAVGSEVASPATAAAVASAAPRVPPGPIRHVWLVSIDGLLPQTYLEPDARGLQVPTLRRLVREGARSDGALSVWPSLTYPAHTTIATGVNPGRHGIVGNLAFDPLGKNQDGWRWYGTLVQVPRVWDAVRDAGYRIALLDWPVTVGDVADYHVPEFWRAKTEDDLALLRAVSSPPGFLDRVAERHPDFWQGFHPQDVSDAAGMDLAETAIALGAPAFLALHIWQVDAAQHRHGLWSAEARAAIETADAQLERLLAATEAAGLGAETALVVVSDHGFAPIERALRPGALLAKHGFVTLDRGGKVTSWRASALSNHGSAHVYLQSEDDPELQRAVTALFVAESKRPNSGIAKVLTRAEATPLGADPKAFLTLEAAPGTTFLPGYDTSVAKPPYQATHGYDPARSTMRASLLVRAPGVKPGAHIVGARLIDVAPTIAAWLGVPLPTAEGVPLRIEQPLP